MMFTIVCKDLIIFCLALDCEHTWWGTVKALSLRPRRLCHTGQSCVVLNGLGVVDLGSSSIFMSVVLDR